MIATLGRVLFGFLVACIAAGAALVLHAETPSQILAHQQDPDFNERLLALGSLALKVATHAAVFSAPFALIAAAFAEWQRLRNVWVYLIAGLAIAAGGFMAQHMSETTGQGTVLNEYAARAFAIAGSIAGLVYWLFAGRLAGGEVPVQVDGEAVAPTTPVSVEKTEPAPAAAPKAAKSSAEPPKTAAAAPAAVATPAPAAAKPAEPKPATAAKPADAKPADKPAADPKKS